MTASLEDNIRWDIDGNKGFAYSILSNDIKGDLEQLLSMYENVMNKSLRVLFVCENASKILPPDKLAKVGNRLHTNEMVDVYVTRSYYDLFRSRFHWNINDLVVVVCTNQDDMNSLKELRFACKMFEIDGIDILDRVIFITDNVESCFEIKTFSRTSTSFIFEPIQFLKQEFDGEISMDHFMKEFNELKEMVESFMKKKGGLKFNGCHDEGDVKERIQ